MGFFDSIGDVFDSVGDAVGGVFDTVSSFASPVLGLAGNLTAPLQLVSSGLGLYNNLSGKDFDRSQVAIDKQIAGQQLTNAQQLEEAQRNRDFQERLSSTAHQREIADLAKAGLNPILSGLGGNGASTPSGSIGNLVNPYSGIAGDVNEARRIDEIQKKELINQTNKTMAEISNLKSSTDLNKQLERKAFSDEALSRANAYTAMTLGDKNYQESMLALEKQFTEKALQLEKASNVQLNSAYALKAQAEEKLARSTAYRTDQEGILRNYDVIANEYLPSIKKWTGPAKEIMETGSDAVDLLPFLPKRKSGGGIRIFNELKIPKQP